MVHPVGLAGFLVAVLPLIATPGASLALLVQHVTDGGRRRALPVVLGTVTGLYVHAALAVAGLSALVMHSSVAFAAVRLVGAVYLIGLGLWTWRSASPHAAPAPRRRSRPRGTDSVYAQALLANVLNPKAASIYLTLIPQFVAPDRPLGGQILTLATAHALLIALWLTAWTFLVLRASHALRTPRFRRTAIRTTSAVLIALGIRSAVA
ncbi:MULTISPECIES: LysE family translocator [unclassified Streptomyces]|uniref:LysE family translocator n=1 Tax=unclassified Streptomyces TaxID=2593676 RepID=UPI002ED5AD2C|nr:LysE family translocator [Streptomyces sp. NBC_00891]WSY07002.1 LysE family translocator [Streptomyces sp. NBC_00890]WSZ08628.1 LysE family translocator [Streptomyces sp. NBC_00869]WSZ23873.1 LysE family translocator [Streptomyces sp. NBC_00870]